jgi:hypothetical protein
MVEPAYKCSKQILQIECFNSYAQRHRLSLWFRSVLWHVSNRNKSRLPYLDQNMCGKVVPVEKLVKMMSCYKLVNWHSPLTRKCILPFNITSKRCSAHLASTRHVVITGTQSYFPCPPCSSTTMTVLKFVERLSTVQIRFWTQPGMVSDPPQSETLGGARHKFSCFICTSTSSSNSCVWKAEIFKACYWK